MLADLSGEASVLSQNGARRPAWNGLVLAPGERVETKGQSSSVTLRFGDGTRFVMVDDSAITWQPRDAKHLELHAGRLLASVTPQKRLLTISTPRAAVRVLGTKFALEAHPEQTDLAVNEGRVAVDSAGGSVQAAQGEHVIARTGATPRVQKIADEIERWSEDFENGLPPDWENGRLVKQGLLPGSHGAVAAERAWVVTEHMFLITAPVKWATGLFSVYADSHVRFRFKFAKKDWFNLVYLSRHPGGNVTELYLCEFVPWWKCEPNVWYEVSVPFSKFHLQHPRHSDDPEMPYRFSISSDEDRGLIVDDLVVERGGSGEIELKRLP
jgi:hypothetical protein